MAWSRRDSISVTMVSAHLRSMSCTASRNSCQSQGRSGRFLRNRRATRTGIQMDRSKPPSSSQSICAQGFFDAYPLENEEAAFLSGKTTVASVTVYDMRASATRRHHRASRSHRWRKAHRTRQFRADRSARPLTEHRHRIQGRRRDVPYARSRQHNRGVRAGRP